MAQWTVIPYVASSSLARGAIFLDVFAQSIHVLFLTVAKKSLTLAALPSLHAPFHQQYVYIFE